MFEHLDAPVRRIGALDTPVAYCPAIEDEILPQIEDVLAAIRKIAAAEGSAPAAWKNNALAPGRVHILAAELVAYLRGGRFAGDSSFKSRRSPENLPRRFSLALLLRHRQRA